MGEVRKTYPPRNKEPCMKPLKPSHIPQGCLPEPTEQNGEEASHLIRKLKIRILSSRTTSCLLARGWGCSLQLESVTLSL
ncbi:hypothetical protein CgunFtcFv8_019939 [Champsocephalus gunnari]|uniref:Uncharacterized protein n=1 Tax=Champsocephalus gunnari TaxID=52237 RepID=A0AAN8DKJ7_CHAGU|nr:hypothetical protein CgunFtcFv8_019939 [Champsocephalus gunnari]